MRFYNIAVTLTAVILLSGCAHNNTEDNPDARRPGTMSSEKVLRHVVLFKFKDEATPRQIQEVEDAFRALPQKIDVIQNLEWGTNVSPENLSQGFTHCFFLSFKDETGRDAYLPHPAHKEFDSEAGG